MSETTLQAESRTEFGKGAARRLRRDAKVPAVLYGHGTDPIHVSLPGHDTMMALKHGGLNALLSIQVQGETRLAIPKQVQRDPVKGFLEHLDLLIVERGEKVTVEVPVHTTGEAGIDTVVTVENPTLTVVTEATHIPESIEVSVEGLQAGTQITIADLDLPAGTVAQGAPEQLVVHVTGATELEAETDSGPVGEPAEADETGPVSDDDDEVTQSGDAAAASEQSDGS
jgi:large subunit ribosomal protein L25